jgi:serine/threonine protein kinase
LFDFDCGNTDDNENPFFVNTYWEYHDNDLEFDIKERRSNDAEFTGHELTAMVRSIVTANAFLQQKGMKHGDIRPSAIVIGYGDQFKLFENIRDQPGKGQIYSMIAEEDVYTSPLVFKNLRRNVAKFEHNRAKSDVFSFGLCLLEAGLLESIQDIYNTDQGRISQTKLTDKIDQFDYRYGQAFPELAFTIKSMLQYDEYNRPDWLTLKEKMAAGMAIKDVNTTGIETHSQVQSSSYNT